MNDFTIKALLLERFCYRKLCIPTYNELYNAVYNYAAIYIIKNNEDSGCYIFGMVITEIDCESVLYNNVYTSLYNDIYHLLPTETINT